jgi:hypothetical protein
VCPPGALLNTTVYTSDGQDHYWAYMFVGVGSSSSSLRSPAERFKLPREACCPFCRDRPKGTLAASPVRHGHEEGPARQQAT